MSGNICLIKKVISEAPTRRHILMTNVCTLILLLKEAILTTVSSASSPATSRMSSFTISLALSALANGWNGKDRHILQSLYSHPHITQGHLILTGHFKWRITEEKLTYRLLKSFLLLNMVAYWIIQIKFARTYMQSAEINALS